MVAVKAAVPPVPQNNGGTAEMSGSPNAASINNGVEVVLKPDVVHVIVLR
jgi:hypothetical protein